MFGILVIDIMFFAIPALLLCFFVFSLYRYLHAKKINKSAPNSFSQNEIKYRKTMLIVSSIIAALFAFIVIGFIFLLYMAIAFM